MHWQPKPLTLMGVHRQILAAAPRFLRRAGSARQRRRWSIELHRATPRGGPYADLCRSPECGCPAKVKASICRAAPGVAPSGAGGGGGQIPGICPGSRTDQVFQNLLGRPPKRVLRLCRRFRPRALGPARSSIDRIPARCWSESCCGWFTPAIRAKDWPAVSPFHMTVANWSSALQMARRVGAHRRSEPAVAESECRTSAGAGPRGDVTCAVRRPRVHQIARPMPNPFRDAFQTGLPDNR